MAIALEQTVTGLDTGSSITLTSWTPGSNELCLLFIAQRNEALAPSVSGNGLTWVEVANIDNTQGQNGVSVWRAMGASPTTGSITVTNVSGFDVAVACRFSGVDTGGTNGSAAVEASGTAAGPAVDDDDAQVSVTTVTDNAWAVAALTHRSATFTTPGGQTTVSINNTNGSAGNTTTCSVVRKTITPAGSATLGGANSLSAATDWCGIAVSVKPATGTAYNQTVSGGITPTGALVKATTHKLSGGITPAGVLVKATTRALAGAITPSGALLASRLFTKALTGTIAPAGALLTQRVKILAGAIAPAGALVRSITKVLTGGITPTGALSRTRIEAPVRQKRGSIFNQNRLSFLVTDGPWRGSNRFVDHSQDITSYDHSHAAMGGFWTANLTMRLPLVELEDWLENGVGRQVQVKGRGTKLAWEGLVNRVTMNVGGYNMNVGPYLDIANKIKLAYSIFLQLGGGNATGIRVATDYTSNALSVARYGILAKVFSVGGVDSSAVANLQALLLERYSQPPRSEDLNLPGDTGLTYFDLKLECIGYAHLFQKYSYNSATTGTQNLSAKLTAIVAAEPNGLFSSSVTTNTIQVPAYENDDAEAWGLIKSMIAMGDVSLNRYSFGVYENRRAVYKPVSNSVVYIRPLREGAAVIQDAQGGLLQPWEVRPGGYVLVTDLLPGKPTASTLNDDRRAIYADTVQYRMPDSLVINGAHSFKVEQRLAQLGISGVG